MNLVTEQRLGAFVPAGTPAYIRARLNLEINNALADPEININTVLVVDERTRRRLAAA